MSLLWLVSSFAGSSSIVGGVPVERGEWNDAARILLDDNTYCTGVLVAPRVVLTAGHCIDVEAPVDVHIGATNLESGGEHLLPEQWAAYPEDQGRYDIGVILLAEDSRWEPRTIGLGCVLRDFLVDGAEATAVGWGTTDPTGNGPRSEELREVSLTILDADCAQTPNCWEPGGEIFGGGGGVGPCFGDSGGPLYLSTDQGVVLVGVDSHGLYDGDQLCGNGEFWVRPDAVIQWLEEQAGGPLSYPSCNEPPSVEVAALETRRNQPVTTEVTITDSDGDAALATVEVSQPPEHGTVQVLDGTQLEYVPERGFVGEDSFVVTVTDAGTDNARTGAPVSVEVEVPVTVGAAGCGCGSGSGASWPWLSLMSLVCYRRARRQGWMS